MTDTTLVVLGIVGASGVGKTTLATILEQDHGFERIQIGQPIKEMLAAIGVPSSNLTGSPEERSAPLDLLGGKSARFAMSALGTDWGRTMISEDIWTNVTRLRIRKLVEIQNAGKKPATRIVLDDLRFPNDWELVTSLGGTIVRVRRRSVERRRTSVDILAQHNKRNVIGLLMKWIRWSNTHESEFFWRDAPATIEIWNEGEISELRSAARNIASIS